MLRYDIRIPTDYKSKKCILNIKIGKDTEKAKKRFDKKSDNYSVFLDKTDKILTKSNDLINVNEYNSVVMPVILGKTIGYEVGNICYNKEIPLIG
jgi:hypothetical protein